MEHLELLILWARSAGCWCRDPGQELAASRDEATGD